MKEIMAIYDTDFSYAKRFADFTNEKNDLHFQTIPFGELRKLQEYANQHPLGILLLGDVVEAEVLKEINTRNVVRLGELGSKIEQGEIVVHKYQSAEQILREVMFHCQDGRMEAEEVLGPTCTMIGVYSPIHGCGKTGFALTLAQILAKSQKVLFLTLEHFSGFETLFSCEYQKGLSELLFQWKSNGHNPFVLGSVIHYFGDLAYIPPVSYPEDLKLFSGKEIGSLLEKLAKESGYEVLVVDFGETGESVETLNPCQMLYIPMKEDPISKIKLEAWKSYLEELGENQILKKSKFLKLPMVKYEQTSGYLEALLWGQLGDYIRSLWKGQGKEWT